MQVHTVGGRAVAAQARGLLPISMPATGFTGRIAYHDYEGPSLELDERARLVRSLGTKKVLILRNHGLLTCASTVEEAFILMLFSALAAAECSSLATCAAAGPGRNRRESSASCTPRPRSAFPSGRSRLADMPTPLATARTAIPLVRRLLPTHPSGPRGPARL